MDWMYTSTPKRCYRPTGEQGQQTNVRRGLLLQGNDVQFSHRDSELTRQYVHRRGEFCPDVEESQRPASPPLFIPLKQSSQNKYKPELLLDVEQNKFRPIRNFSSLSRKQQNVKGLEPETFERDNVTGKSMRAAPSHALSQSREQLATFRRKESLQKECTRTNDFGSPSIRCLLDESSFHENCCKYVPEKVKLNELKRIPNQATHYMLDTEHLGKCSRRSERKLSDSFPCRSVHHVKSAFRNDRYHDSLCLSGVWPSEDWEYDILPLSEDLCKYSVSPKHNDKTLYMDSLISPQEDKLRERTVHFESPEAQFCRSLPCRVSDLALHKGGQEMRDTAQFLSQTADCGNQNRRKHLNEQKSPTFQRRWEKSSRELKAKDFKEISNRREQNQQLSQSLGSAEHSIRLIQLLYHSDCHTRHNAILLARWFRCWRRNVHTLKTRRQNTAHLTNVAHTFHRTSKLKKHFGLWRAKFHKMCKFSRALTLQQRHLARKALNALSWALCQSRLEMDDAGRIYDFKLVRRVFFWWRDSYERRAAIKWQTKIRIWQREADLHSRFREFESRRNKETLHECFCVWKAVFTTTRGNRLANEHYKHIALSHCFHTWSVFAAETKVKGIQISLARVTRDRQLKTRWFYRWLTYFKQRQQANACNRRLLVKRYWGLWSGSLAIHRANTQRFISQANVHRHRALLAGSLRLWMVQLLQLKVARVDRLRVLNKTWLMWKQLTKEKVAERATRERLIKANVLRKLKIYSQVSKQRAKAATDLLRISLCRRLFNRWHGIAARKKRDRKQLRLCQSQSRRLTLRMTFGLWSQQAFWSRWGKFAMRVAVLNTKRHFWDKWKERLKMRKLDVLEKRMAGILKQLRLNWVFTMWRSQTKQSQQAALLSESVQSEISEGIKRRVFREWRVLTHQSITIQPLIHKGKRRQLFRAFDGWRSIVLRKKTCAALLVLRNRVQVFKVFLWWRIRYLSRSQARECDKMWVRSVTKVFFHRWLERCKSNMAAVKFRDHILCRKFLWKWKFCYRLKKSCWLNLEPAQVQDLKRKCFRRLKLYTGMRKGKKKMEKLAEDTYRAHLLKRAITCWKHNFHERSLMYPPHRLGPLSFRADHPLLCTGERVRDAVRRNRLRQVWGVWVTQFVQISAVKIFWAQKVCGRFLRTWHANSVAQRQMCAQIAENVYNRQKLRQALTRWQVFWVRLQDLDLKVEWYWHHRNTARLQRAWATWSERLLLKRANRAQALASLQKYFIAWRLCAKDSADQRLRCRAFHRAIEERTMRTVFTHWKRRQFAVRLNVSFDDGLFMSSGYRSWQQLERHLAMLERLCRMFLSTHEQTLLWNMFMLWKDCLHRNQILDETKDVLKRQRNSQAKRRFFRKWKHWYDKSVAKAHYLRAVVRKSFNIWRSQRR